MTESSTKSLFLTGQRECWEHIMAQVNKEAAAGKKKEIITAMCSLCQMPQRFPFFEEPISP